MWSTLDVVREAGRNLRLPHAIILALVASLLYSAGLFEATSTASTIARFEDWLASGGMVVTVERVDGIGGTQCADVAVDDVVLRSGGAGAIDGASTVVFDRSPSVEYTLQPMTVGAIEIVTGESPGVGWTVGTIALNELGREVGDLLSVGGSGSVVAGDFGSGVRKLGYDRDVLVAVPAAGRRFPVCLVELRPAAFGTATDFIAARFPADALVRPFRRTEARDHAAVRYRERASQFGWIFSGAATGTAWFGWFWVRRRELILYRSLGVSRAGLVLMGVVEVAITTMMAGLMAAAAIVISVDQLVPRRAGVWVVGLGALLGILASYVALLPIVRRNVASATRDLS